MATPSINCLIIKEWKLDKLVKDTDFGKGNDKGLTKSELYRPMYLLSLKNSFHASYLKVYVAVPTL